MDPVSSRELIVAVLAALWSVVLGVMTFRRQSREQNNAREDLVQTNTIARWKELYDQKCSDHTNMKSECAENAAKMAAEISTLKDRLTTEQIRSGGLQSDLRQCRRDLRECREAKGLEEPDGDAPDGEQNPGGG